MMSVVPGMIIVPMTSAKSAFLPGKRKRARQNASADETKAAITTVSTATITLLRKLI